MRRIGRVGWAGRLGVLAVVTLAMLLSAAACDRESAVTQERATTPAPAATPQRVIIANPNSGARSLRLAIRL